MDEEGTIRKGLHSQDATNEAFESAGMIDHGKPFDWKNTSDAYARYRDIYPDVLFEKLSSTL
jgi:hypothetical protein